MQTDNVLPGRRVSISNRLNYFNAVVSSAACLRNGHRAGNLQLPAGYFGFDGFKYYAK